jgi:hypothetical protein
LYLSAVLQLYWLTLRSQVDERLTDVALDMIVIEHKQPYGRRKVRVEEQAREQERWLSQHVEESGNQEKGKVL